MVVFNFLIYCMKGFFLHGTIRSMQTLRQATKRIISTNEKSIILRHTIAVVNCFVSWIIIACVSVPSWFGEHTDQNIDAWTLGLVFTLNACCNPILYTFATLTFKQQIQHILRHPLKKKISIENLFCMKKLFARVCDWKE